MGLQYFPKKMTELDKACQQVSCELWACQEDEKEAAERFLVVDDKCESRCKGSFFQIHHFRPSCSMTVLFSPMQPILSIRVILVRLLCNCVKISSVSARWPARSPKCFATNTVAEIRNWGAVDDDILGLTIRTGQRTSHLNFRLKFSSNLEYLNSLDPKTT